MADAKKNTGSGYLGDLSADQEKTFAAFKASARPTGAKEDVTNDDYQLLRFLRYRLISTPPPPPPLNCICLCAV